MYGVEATVAEWRPRHVYKTEEKAEPAESRWRRIERVILDALQPFMEARQAVARALLDFERQAPT